MSVRHVQSIAGFAATPFDSKGKARRGGAQ